MAHSNTFAPEALTIYQIDQLFNEWRQSNDDWQALDLSSVNEMDAAGLQFVASLLKQPDSSLQVKLPDNPQIAEYIQSALDTLTNTQGGGDD
ncbi:hypothetical protein QWY20_12645 [Alkalimonas sp. MEB108]|uniref:STAS domain-containing protein n=1 Tax=Alkalimonas cellulosilytica TaxID=3058395 RepID=A0ABU7J714_9GAMM|nr:hypothetical protein [Alkalimonas sp. MEB108]MEE2002303.1 hypothetical protein [Alkalimonas sp. MEB108]